MGVTSYFSVCKGLLVISKGLTTRVSESANNKGASAEQLQRLKSELLMAHQQLARQSRAGSNNNSRGDERVHELQSQLDAAQRQLEASDEAIKAAAGEGGAAQIQALQGEVAAMERRALEAEAGVKAEAKLVRKAMRHSAQLSQKLVALQQLVRDSGADYSQQPGIQELISFQSPLSSPDRAGHGLVSPSPSLPRADSSLPEPCMPLDTPSASGINNSEEESMAPPPRYSPEESYGGGSVQGLESQEQRNRRSTSGDSTPSESKQRIAEALIGNSERIVSSSDHPTVNEEEGNTESQIVNSDDTESRGGSSEPAVSANSEEPSDGSPGANQVSHSLYSLTIAIFTIRAHYWVLRNLSEKA